MAVTEPAVAELLTTVSQLVRTARSYAHQRNQQLGRTGLPYGILVKLHLGARRPGDLAVLLGTSPSAVSRAVAGLVDEGFVRRTADPCDARACSLALTEAGEAELAELQREQTRVVSRLLADWDDAKAATLTALLTELGAAFTAASHLGPPAPPLTSAPTSSSTSEPTTRTPASTSEKAYA